MRHPTSRENVRQVMQAIGTRIRQPLKVYFTGGALPAIMEGWGSMIETSTLGSLPGFEIYREGVEAIGKGDYLSASALLVSMARTRLGHAGLPIPEVPVSGTAHLEYYKLLAQQYPDPHYRYNASLQRLEKFCRAVERAARGRKM